MGMFTLSKCGLLFEPEIGSRQCKTLFLHNMLASMPYYAAVR